MKKTAVAFLYAGYKRLAGILVYNPLTKEFEEITVASAKQLVKSKQINGLRWEEDNFQLDSTFNQVDMPVKTAVGRFRSYINEKIEINSKPMYSLVRYIDTDYRGRIYEVINNRCGRVKIDEEQLKKLAEITIIAGCFVTKQEIQICKGVEYENRRSIINIFSTI